MIRTLPILLLVLGIFAPQAHADIGCEIKLCLAAIAGHRPSECDPAMNVLKNLIKKGKPIPDCKEDRSGNVVYGQSYYNYCPKGLVAGQGLILSASPQSPLYSGIGEGDNIRRTEDDHGNYNPLPYKTCVGQKLGTKTVIIGYEDDGRMPIYGSATVYKTVVTKTPLANPQFADVFINGKLYTRARW